VDSITEAVVNSLRAGCTLLLAIALFQPSASANLTDLERQRLVAHLTMTAAWLRDEVSGLTTAQARFRPSPGAWSVLQVLEHLVVVGPIYWDDLQKAVAAPPRDRPSGMTDDAVLWYGIDRTWRETAIPTEDVKGTLSDIRRGLDAHRRNHDRLLQYISTTKDDLRHRYVPRQGSDAYQWALLISTHEQRHILQIREIKSHPSFPRR
jgi:hypothetical protein